MEVRIELANGTPLAKRVPAPPEAKSNHQSDILAIVTSLFIVEDQLHRGRSISTVSIPVYDNPGEKTRETLEDIVAFLFSRSIAFKFVKNPQTRFTNVEERITDGYTALFSGGMDSLSGILNAQKEFGKVDCALSRHADQQFPNALMARLRTDNPPFVIRELESLEHGRYTRVSRGLLYLCNGMLLGNRNLIISEVGPTMFQPRLTLMDQVSLTTHPKILQLGKKLCEQIFGSDVRILKPNENLTKAEVAACILRPELAKLSCSCRSTQFCNSGKPGCGICYGCIIRRFGMLVAGVDDCNYRDENLVTTNSASYDDVLELLRFSMDFIADPDQIPSFSTREIKKKNTEKLGLFERYALDNLAGFFLLSKIRKLPSMPFGKILDSLPRIVSQEKLENRIASVREKQVQPEFGNLVSLHQNESQVKERA